MRIYAGQVRLGCIDYNIFLDNVLVKNCTAADDEEGWVEYIDEWDWKLGSSAPRRHYGQVRIEEINEN
jgi:hypothetical protein